MLMMKSIKFHLSSCCLILIFSYAQQVPASADFVPMASLCTKSKFAWSLDPELTDMLLLKCYDNLWLKSDGTVFRSTSFQHWWLRCKEEFADQDDARLECFIENNFWENPHNGKKKQ